MEGWLLLLLLPHQRGLCLGLYQFFHIFLSLNSMELNNNTLKLMKSSLGSGVGGSERSERSAEVAFKSRSKVGSIVVKGRKVVVPFWTWM